MDDAETTIMAGLQRRYDPPPMPPAGPIRGLTELEASAKAFFEDAKLTSAQARKMMEQIEASPWWQMFIRNKWGHE